MNFAMIMKPDDKVNLTMIKTKLLYSSEATQNSMLWKLSTSNKKQIE